MTEVAFHFNAPDKLAYACRLLRKALGSGAQIVVTGEAETLRALDQTLWTFSPTEFVPHCLVDEALPAPVLSASPVVLSEQPLAAPHQQVLVNLGLRVPQGFERFGRLIEVVSRDDGDDRIHARNRWRHYADRGYAIQRHDLVLKG